jgi:hypothetical protein
MCYNYILLKVFIKNVFFSNQKVRVSSCLLWSFVCSGRLGVIYDSYMTSRSAAGEGLSQGVLPASYWSSGSHKWLPAAWLRPFFIAICIRVNMCWKWLIEWPYWTSNITSSISISIKPWANALWASLIIIFRKNVTTSFKWSSCRINQVKLLKINIKLQEDHLKIGSVSSRPRLIKKGVKINA